MRLTVEQAEKVAHRFLGVARDLGSAMTDADSLAKEGASSVLEESEAYETLMLQGENVLVALRTLAMRLDRAALVKFES